MADLPRIVDELSKLTVLEASELSRLLEQKWGVSAAAPVVQHTVPTVEPIVKEAEVQTEFQVILTALVSPDKKISVIKEIRAITQLGLKEAKEFVESAPKVIRETATKVDADAIKAQVEAAGGVVELK